MKRRMVVLVLMISAIMSLSSVAFGKDPVPISMWIVGQPGGVLEMLKDFETKFNAANPDIVLSINATANFGSDYRDKVVVTTASGIGPDLFYDASNNVLRWVVSGIAKPLDNYFNAKPDKADFLPEVMQLMQFKGQTYGFPFSIWSIYSLYNLDLFAKAGVSEPTNWNEMLTTVRKLTRTNGTQIETFGWRTAGANAVLAFGDLQLTLEQLGSTTIPMEGLQATLNTPEALRAMNYLSDLRAAGMPGSNGGSSFKDVLSGTVAIQHWASTNQDFLNTLQTTYVEGLNIGMRRFVGPTPSTDAIVVFAGTLMMNSSSKHPDEAWRVLEAFTNRDNMLDYLVAREFHQPVRKSLFTNRTLMQLPYQPELMRLVYPPMTTSGSRHPFYTQFRDQVGRLLVEAVSGRQAISGTLQEAERLLTAIVQSENVSNGNFLK